MCISLTHSLTHSHKYNTKPYANTNALLLESFRTTWQLSRRHLLPLHIEEVVPVVTHISLFFVITDNAIAWCCMVFNATTLSTFYLVHLPVPIIVVAVMVILIVPIAIYSCLCIVGCSCGGVFVCRLLLQLLPFVVCLLYCCYYFYWPFHSMGQATLSLRLLSWPFFHYVSDHRLYNRLL